MTVLKWLDWDFQKYPIFGNLSEYYLFCKVLLGGLYLSYFIFIPTTFQVLPVFTIQWEQLKKKVWKCSLDKENKFKNMLSAMLVQ